MEKLECHGGDGYDGDSKHFTLPLPLLLLYLSNKFKTNHKGFSSKNPNSHNGFHANQIWSMWKSKLFIYAHAHVSTCTYIYP